MTKSSGFTFAAACAVFIACGGSSSSGIGSAPGTDGGTSNGGVDAGEDGSTTGARYTLDNVCELTAPKICELRKPCCEKTHGYDEDACIKEAKADCEKDVAEAREGRMTFHPDRIDPCVVKFKTVLDTCYESFALLYDAFDLATCRIFEGNVAEGAECERTSQCKPPDGEKALVDCNEASGACKVTRLLQENEACSYTDDAPGFCDKGLYCNAPEVQPQPGTCKKATALGATCDKAQLISVECGLGAYCEPTTSKCTAAKKEGESCETALECESFSCNDSGGSGKTCQPLKPIVEADECK